MTSSWRTDEMNWNAIVALPLLAMLAGCTFLSEQAPAPQAEKAPAPPEKTYAPPEQKSANGASEPKVPLKIVFIDVGYGDATLIQAGKKNILFDAGPAGAEEKVKLALSQNGVEKLDVLALSSNAPEHVGGAAEVSTSYPIESVWTNGVNYTGEDYQNLLVRLSYAHPIRVEYGDTFTFDNVNFTILNPQKDRYLLSSAPDSIAMKVEYGNFCVLLFSDSQAGSAAGNDMGTVVGGIDAKIVSGSLPIKCQVLKVSHHGSGISASFQLLEKAKPKTAIISVGEKQGSTLPEPVLLERLLLKGITTYRTDVSGTITITTDGQAYNITAAR